MTPNFIPNKIVLASYYGIGVDDRDVTYNGETRYRINQNSTLYMTGYAYYNNYPVPNTRVELVALDPSWSEGSSNYRSLHAATTNSNGYFSSGVSIPHAAGAYWVQVGFTIPIYHVYDKGYVWVQSLEKATLTSDVKNIYIFGGSQ